MGGRSDEQHATSQKSPRPEPNLELPSFRLRRKKKAEPSVVAPEPSVVAPPEHRPPPPPPGRVTPPPPPAAKRVAPPPPPPPPPAAKPVHAPPAPPRPHVPPAPPVLPSVPEETQVLPKVDDVPAKREKPRKEPKPPREPKPAKPAKEPKPPREPKPPKPAKEPRPPKAPREKRERSTEPLRWLPGYLASIITGVLCGGLTVLLAWATAQGCAAVRGVGTCGGYGVFALVAILGIDVVIATGLLRLARVVDPATTALLGVGMVAVLAMVFFLGQTQSFAMVYVIPILMGVTFDLAWWVTAAIARRVED